MVFRGRSVKDEQSGDEGGGEAASDDPAELSTQVTAPGVLKIFGGEICDGANYKSVLATPRSSAHELVKEALERYSLDKGRAGEFVLCDVIGKLDGEHQWRPECLRAVGDGEKPLTLQALWKPKEGFARRFELRCRAAMEEMAARERDTVTAGTSGAGSMGSLSLPLSLTLSLHLFATGINAQARKMQVTRSRASSALMGEEMEWGAAIWRTLSDSTLGTETREHKSHSVGVQEDRDPPCLGLEKEETESSDDIATLYSVRPPIEFPYFLLLQGYCDRQDYVIYTMSGTVHIFGRNTEHSGEREERVKVDMLLSAPDILPRHCRVQRCEAGGGQEPRNGVTLVWPGKGALVTHNGRPLSRETELQPGDLLGLGACYLLMYKDPTRPGSSHKPSWFPGLAACPDAGGGRCRVCGLELPDPGTERARLRGREAVPSLHAPDGRQLRLCYQLPQEPRLLGKILDLAGWSSHSTLAPAFLLCLAIQHSASTFSLADFRKLLLSIASHIQTMMWVRTYEQRDCQDCLEPNIAELIPGLQPLVYWMSNSVELLHFIQQEVPRLLGWEQQLEDPQLVSTRAASEEAMTVLEEVIMFTFQQSVYYLTKTLYTVLPGLLDSNPFAAGSTQLTVPVGVQNVLEILQETLKLLSQYQVHSDIASQLLAYLFFFSNASLFNTLMERGSGGGFYQWTKGVQIRANLDLLLDWIQGLGLGDLAAEFFQKLSTAVNLLATPRENLLQASWRSLRNDFASLNPAQLHHMIREYNPGRPAPPCGNRGLRTDILESFDNHPPLILPTSTFHFALDQPVADAQRLSGLLHIPHLARPTLPPISGTPSHGLPTSHPHPRLLQDPSQDPLLRPCLRSPSFLLCPPRSPAWVRSTDCPVPWDVLPT
uniref:Ras association and DIL domains 2a n=1 Tax=Callorhinchus milii TaxID=7868 RepID=A0A4W3GCD9_CALMI